MVAPQRTRLHDEEHAPTPVGERSAPDVVSAPPVPHLNPQPSLQQATTLLRQPSAARGGSLQRALMQLQHTYGNRAVQRLVTAARRETDGVSPEIDTAIQHSRGLGQGLDSSTRDQMEAAFGTDFSGVRLHTEADADALSQSLAARAFTTGSDIYFRRGEYNPGSSGGRSLLAHELTHVVQQRGATPQTKLTVNEPGDIYEQEADAVAEQLTRFTENGAGQHPHQNSYQSSIIQRQIQNTGEPANTDKAKLDQLRSAVRILENKIYMDKGRRDEQEKINKDQWAVSWTSEVAGSVAGAFRGKGLRGLNIPDKSLWNVPDQLLKEVKDYIKAGDVIRAAHSLQNLVDIYTKVHEQLYDYLEGVISGAEITETGLQVLATAGAIAASVATGGTAGVLVGAGYVAGQRLAGEATGVIIGTQQKIDWAGIGFDALFAIAAGKLGGKFGGKLAEKLGTVIAARLAGQVTARLVTSLIIGRLSAVVHAAAREVFDSIRWDTQLTVDGVIDRMVAQMTLKAVFMDLVTHAAAEAVSSSRGAASTPPPPKRDYPPLRPVQGGRPGPVPMQGGKVVSQSTGSSSTRARASSEPFVGSGESPAKAYVPEPEPVINPTPSPQVAPEPVPVPAPSTVPNTVAVTNTNEVQSTVATVAVSTSDATKKQQPKRPVRLILPSVKAIHLARYRQLVAAGVLVHNINYDRPDVDQSDNWDRNMRPGSSEGMFPDVYLRGRNLGLSRKRIFRPNWSRLGTSVQMQVDHVVELQVTEPAEEHIWDDFPNYELLDQRSNVSSGPRLQQNITKERQALATETGDQTWLTRQLRFEEVSAESGPQGIRWLLDEIRTGEHLDVYEDYIHGR